MKTKLFIVGLAAILLSAGVITAQTPKIESVYTDLSEKSCKTLESSTENSGWYRGECPGVGERGSQNTCRFRSNEAVQGFKKLKNLKRIKSFKSSKNRRLFVFRVVFQF